MQQQDYQCNITTDVTSEEALDKISRVNEWWGVTFTGSAKKQNDTFVATMGGDSFFNFTVAEFIPGKKVVWLVTDCNMPWYSDKKEWANTKLIFALSENDGVTTLNFKHEGLTPSVECYNDCATSWAHFIKTSLVSFFTTGKGELSPA